MEKQIFVVGDIHGQWKNFLMKLERLQMENAHIFLLGDNGLGFIDIERDIHNLKCIDDEMKARNIDLYLIRGNHENPRYFKKSMIENEFRLLDNVHIVEDYTTYEINGNVFLCLGGAVSIDEMLREVGKDYWPGEMFVLDTKKLDELAKNQLHIDNLYDKKLIVLAHDIPTEIARFPVHNLTERFKFVTDQIQEKCVINRRNLGCAVTHLKDYGIVIDKWYAGHYHVDHKEFIRDNIELTIVDCHNFVEI